MKHSIVAILAVLVATTAFCSVPIKAQEPKTPFSVAQPNPNYDIAPLYDEVRRIAHRYYPDVTSHHLDNRIHFEFNTRIFIIHEPLMTGEWQDPREVRGPQRGGIQCDVMIIPGNYNGQAAVPQSFDKRYFTEYLMAPYSKELDAHLYVLVKYPRNVPDGFLKDLTEQLNNFGKVVTKIPPKKDDKK